LSGHVREATYRGNQRASGERITAAGAHEHRKGMEHPSQQIAMRSNTRYVLAV
jgi:hypothetical protein